MRRRDLILAFAAAAGFAGSALAEAEHSAAGQNIDLAPVALPVVLNGRLVNYVFLNIRINLAPGVNRELFRSREPYLRDALIRAGHRTPFTLPSDLTRVDDNRVKASLMQSAAGIAGPRAILSIVITSETPRQRYGLPRTGPAGPPIVP